MGIMISIGVIGLAGLTGVSLYNGLVRLKEAAAQQFAQIDVELQRRNDLVPNLVQTVKGYAGHESETLLAVVEARKQLIALPQSATPEKKLALSDQLSGSLSRLLAVSENYPDLKASRNFLELQEELTNTENRISGVRQTYNRSVMQYNTKLATIPTNIIGRLAGFEKMTFLEAPAAARDVPTVTF